MEKAVADKTITFEAEDASRSSNAIAKLTEMATTHLNLRTGELTQAVLDFKTGTTAHINDHLHGLTGKDAQFSWGPLVDGLIATIGLSLFPAEAAGAELAKIAYETAAKMIAEGLSEAVHAAQEHATDPVARLQASVDALAHEISVREGRALAHVQEQIPTMVADALSEYENPPTDDAWLTQMCDWLGFPQPTRGTIYHPIRQQLEYDFVGILAQVQAELEQEKGLADAHDTGSPEQWSTEARLDEQRLYHQEGEQAWDDAYKMSDE